MDVIGRHVCVTGRVLNCISENLRKAIEELAPEKTVRPKKKRPPWIDTELQILIDKESDILLTELNKVCNETETKTRSCSERISPQARIGDALDIKTNM